MGSMSWALITGEYPPQTGGVSDYTRSLATALAADGDAVTVFAPPCEGAPVEDAGVRVIRLPDRFGERARTALRAGLDAIPGPRAAVLQYVPQSFGLRGCNIPFTSWLRGLRDYPLWVMFHEVSVTVRPTTPLKYRIQALATRAMAVDAVGAAGAAFVATQNWEPLLHRLSTRVPDVTCVPVPSNVALTADPLARNRVREPFAHAGREVVFGHFGTYRDAAIRETLAATLPPLLERVPHAATMLIGSGSDAFAAELGRAFPALRERVTGSGRLDADAIAAHIAACDVMLQPYEDGVTTRRSSLIASLPLGVPAVTTDGTTTEPLWRASEAVALVPDGDVAAFVAGAADLALDAPRRAALAAHARYLYHSVFALDKTVAALRRRTAIERRIAS